MSLVEEVVLPGDQASGQSVQRSLLALERALPDLATYATLPIHGADMVADTVTPREMLLYASGAACNANTAVPFGSADVPGATFTVPAGGAGVYEYVCTFDFDITVIGVGALVGEMWAAGVQIGGDAVLQPSAVHRCTVMTCGVTPSLAAGDIVKMRHRKTVNAGTATTISNNTKFMIKGPY